MKSEFIHHVRNIISLVIYSLSIIVLISNQSGNTCNNSTQIPESVISTAIKTLSENHATSDTSKSCVIQRNINKTTTRNKNIRYLLYLPWHYSESKTSWPLLLYLHGSMGRGDDFEKMAWYPIPKMMLQNDSLPFIIIAPQCPEGTIWNDGEMLVSLIYDICDSFKVDTNRIYLAGYSMGGAGVWYLAYKFPDIFAAIAPMSGPSKKFYADRICHIPVWIFHGLNDSTVSVHESEDMLKALRDHDAEVKTSFVPGRGHVPPSIEEHKELFNWMFQHTRVVSDSVSKPR